jgi:CubicO group peptidase (beta-lactamase class C family)
MKQSMSGGLSKTRLEHMHHVMAGYVERGELPGLVTLLARRGAVHVDVVGAQALGGAPMQRNTIFRISSMTKPVTAVAAMILVEECKLRLDEPVDELLPELAGRQVLKRLDGPLDETMPAKRSITLRDLLTLRMGFGQVNGSPEAYPILKAADELQIGMGPPTPSATPAPDEWMCRLGTLPLMRQPGEAWIYNTGSDVLGVLIARAAGQPLEIFLRERIFEPLGMRDTGFSVPAGTAGRFATSYSIEGAGGAIEVFDPAAGGQWTSPPAFPSGAGGLVSTVDDFLAFGQMLLDKGKYGGERMLSRLTGEAMTSDQLTVEQRAGAADFLSANRGWGFGLSIITQRDDISAVPGRFGWEGGLGTSWASDPKEELVGILMTQMAWSSPSGLRIWKDFWTSAYAAIDD